MARKAKATSEELGDELEEAAGDAGADGGSADDGGSDHGGESLEDRIVSRLASLVGVGGSSSSDGDNGGARGVDGGRAGDRGGEEVSESSRATGAQTELDFEAKVRTALARVRHEEETDNRLAALEENASKPAPEEPPVKLSRLTRALWGSDERKAPAR